ncbi:family 43 putative glycoside hydrolase [Cladorrhinum sp. PSN332]|nr:family 43 putative glycoside hydrolase [Cladorrhinum sp. PSN332]
MLLALLLPFLPFTTPAPQTTLGNLDFPDPSITYDPTTQKWYAFATQSDSIHVQVATSPSFPVSTDWTYLSHTDILPVPGKWVNPCSPRIWAPDIHFLNSTQTWIMYYSGLLSGSGYHCIGTAVSNTSILGPYTAHDEPFVCPTPEGGAIDASGFLNEEDGTRYVIYKVDGSAKGPGGPCGNGIPPGEPTPFRLQQVDPDDGVTKIGDEVEVLDRDPELDGPLIEAPSLVKVGSRWLLFYSSHCYNSEDYDVKYAVSENGVKGPYVRGGQLIGKEKRDFGFVSPGGASGIVVDQSGKGAMVFHADCPAGRCMYETEWVMGIDGIVGVVE